MKTSNSKAKVIEAKEEVYKITASQLKEELKRENYKTKYLKLLKSTIFVIVIIAAFSVLIATLIMPVLEIKGSSMSPIYDNGDIAVLFKTKNIKKNDIVAFYYGNKILIKRVVGVASDWINITDKGEVYVNGKIIEEPYLKNSKFDIGDIKYPYQVPDGSLFVLSDDRLDTSDSRFLEIGTIKNDDIIGKVLFKIWPLK